MLYWIWFFVLTVFAVYFVCLDNRAKGTFNSFNAMVATASIICALWVSFFIILSPLFHFLMGVLPQKGDAINPITSMVITVAVAALYVCGVFKIAGNIKLKDKSQRTASNGC